MSSALQARIDILRVEHASDPDTLAYLVNQLIQQEHVKSNTGGISAYPSAGSSTASSSYAGVNTPQQSSSRSGRIIKQPKQYMPPAAALPSRASPQVQPPPAPRTSSSSSLNPHSTRLAPVRVPLSSSPAPVPPMTRISEQRYQAMYTTYPARMRLGTSSLMQPNALAASGTGTNAPAGGGKRARAVVNYAEMQGLVENPDEGPQQKRAGSAAAAGGEAKTVWGDGKSYLGVLPPGNLVVVQQARGTKHTAFTEDQLEEQAEKPAIFVPIQIDIDVDTFKIRDAFVWNINEKLITPEAFARVFCDDLDIPSSWAAEVAKQITDQCAEQTGVAEIPVRGEEDARQDIEKDLRVVLNLDVQIGTLHLVDRVEWDLSSSLTPELFAAVLVRDLSLSSSAAPLIAHALHNELFRLKKSCLEMGLVGVEEDGRRRGARPLEGVWREWTDTLSFGPRVEVLSLDEMDRVEADRERAIRRAKRDKVTGASRTGGRRR